VRQFFQFIWRCIAFKSIGPSADEYDISRDISSGIVNAVERWEFVDASIQPQQGAKNRTFLGDFWKIRQFYGEFSPLLFGIPPGGA
jgi:hypothetical protein